MGELENEMVGSIKFHPSCTIRRETCVKAPCIALVVIPQQSSQVHRRVILRHRAKVHDSRDLVSREQNVFAAKIANTGLNCERHILPPAQRLNRAWRRPRDHRDCMPHERVQFRR